MASTNVVFDTGFVSTFSAPALHAGFNAAVPRQEYDRQSRADFIQPLLHVEPIELGHAHVEQYTAPLRTWRICQKLMAGFIDYDLVIGGPEQSANRDAKRRVVVNYVDDCRCVHRSDYQGRTEYRPYQNFVVDPIISAQAEEGR